MDEAIKEATRRWQRQHQVEGWGCDWCGAGTEILEPEYYHWRGWVNILNADNEAIAGFCPDCASLYEQASIAREKRP